MHTKPNSYCQRGGRKTVSSDILANWPQPERKSEKETALKAETIMVHLRYVLTNSTVGL